MLNCWRLDYKITALLDLFLPQPAKLKLVRFPAYIIKEEICDDGDSPVIRKKSHSTLLLLFVYFYISIFAFKEDICPKNASIAAIIKMHISDAIQSNNK